MTKRLLIPDYAKRASRRALFLRKRRGKSAKQGVVAGVNQAKFLLKNRYMSLAKAKVFNRFYQRFKNCRTKRCEGAMNLWGSRKFLKFRVMKFVKLSKKRK